MILVRSNQPEGPFYFTLSDVPTRTSNYLYNFGTVRAGTITHSSKTEATDDSDTESTYTFTRHLHPSVTQGALQRR